MMNASGAEEEYDDAFEEIVDDMVPGQQEAGSKRQAKPRPASNRGRPAQPQTSQIQGAAAVGQANTAMISAQLQNELVDKEVE